MENTQLKIVIHATPWPYQGAIKRYLLTLSLEDVGGFDMTATRPGHDLVTPESRPVYRDHAQN